MRRYEHEIVVPTTAEKLYRALTDVSQWPRWDEGLELVEHDGQLAPGSRFVLKPRGGPRVAMTIEAAEAPTRFVDLSHLPLAKMRTSHELVASADGRGTRVRIVIEVFGPLAFLWDRLVARGQAAGCEAQTRALAAFAERRS
jgi:uncharacterized protein YndB with AHSA1/START domain